MRNLTNYHSHCTFCDGRAPLEEYVKSAIAAGFTAYGFSSHAPLPFSTGWTMERSRVADYLQQTAHLKEKYAGQIELYTGMEIDYLDGENHPGNAYFQGLPLDFRIGSVHMVHTDEGEIVDTDTGVEGFRYLLQEYFRGDLRAVVTRYFEASRRMLDAGGFDIIGHADKIAYNAALCEPGVAEKGWYRRLRGELFDWVKEQGVMLEINTKAWLKRGCFFPAQERWREVLDRQIPIVVNSDVHLPELVNSGRPEALAALKATGFRTVRELHGGEWQEVEIE